MCCQLHFVFRQSVLAAWVVSKLAYALELLLLSVGGLGGLGFGVYGLRFGVLGLGPKP